MQKKNNDTGAEDIFYKYLKRLYGTSLNAFARKYGLAEARDIKTNLISKDKDKKFRKKYGKKKGEELLQAFVIIFEQKFRSLNRKPFRMGAGEECEICSYKDDPEILHIHHLKPGLKKKETDEFITNYKDKKIADWVPWWNKYSKYWITVCWNCHKRVDLKRFPFWKNRREFLSWKKKNT